MGDLLGSGEHDKDSYGPPDLEREHSASTLQSTSSSDRDSSTSSLSLAVDGQPWMTPGPAVMVEGLESMEEIMEEKPERLEHVP
jgi:hypothetical protein